MSALILSQNDKFRLDAILNNVGLSDKNAKQLFKELSKAEVIPHHDVPLDVIVMESFIEMEDLQTQKKRSVQLVYPDDADYESGKISILAPIGTALIGYRKGDEISWEMPGGKKNFRILDVKRTQ